MTPSLFTTMPITCAGSAVTNRMVNVVSELMTGSSFLYASDWIKHLQEQDEQPHPLAGQHINQGSMDAAADAYEAEYNAARGKE